MLIFMIYNFLNDIFLDDRFSKSKGTLRQVYCLLPLTAGDPSWPKPDVLHKGQHLKVQENGAGIESQVRYQHKQQ